MSLEGSNRVNSIKDQKIETDITMESSSPGPIQPTPKRRLSLLIGSQNSPSLAFLHKPARNSGNDSKECRKLMEENTRKNKMRNSDRDVVLSPSASSITDADEVSLSHSPSALSFPLIRKKSGEFVRSSLKGHSRSLSLPSTPSYKQVHFGGDKEAQIKYFDERDTPQAISGNNSPTETEQRPRDYFSIGGSFNDLYSDYDESAIDDDDYDDVRGSSYSDDSYSTKLLLRGEWKLTLLNFPELSYTQKFKEHAEVFLERIFISDNKENLYGQIAVHNVSFEKKVVVRYSLDGWRSVTEIDCHYVTNATAKLRRNKYDRFEFEIPLVTLFHNTEESVQPEFTDISSRFALCIKYHVLGKDFWENNKFDNFNIILHKITPRKSNTHRVDTHYPKTAKHSSKFLAMRKETSRMASPAEDFGLQEPGESELTDDEMTGPKMASHFADVASRNFYSPSSRDDSIIGSTPYSSIKRNPHNRAGFDVDAIDLKYPPPKSPLSPISSPIGHETIPDIQSPDSSNSSPKNQNNLFQPAVRPPISSVEYQELLAKYCFFGGESSKSKLQSPTDLEDYKDQFKDPQKVSHHEESSGQPTYFLGNNAGFFNSNSLGDISSFDSDNLALPTLSILSPNKKDGSLQSQEKERALLVSDGKIKSNEKDYDNNYNVNESNVESYLENLQTDKNLKPSGYFD